MSELTVSVMLATIYVIVEPFRNNVIMVMDENGPHLYCHEGEKIRNLVHRNQEHIDMVRQGLRKPVHWCKCESRKRSMLLGQNVRITFSAIEKKSRKFKTYDLEKMMNLMDALIQQRSVQCTVSPIHGKIVPCQEQKDTQKQIRKSMFFNIIVQFRVTTQLSYKDGS